MKHSGAVMLVMLSVAVSFDATGGFTRLNNEITSCPRNDPTVSKCIARAMQYYMNFMYHGRISDRTFVTPLDPLPLPDASLVNNPDIVATFSNRHMSGFKHAYITNLETDFNRFEMQLQLHVAALDTRGSYHAELVRHPEIAEWSEITSSMRNCTFELQLKGTSYDSDGRYYVKTKIVEWSQHIGDHTVRFRWFTMSGNYSRHSETFEAVRGRDILGIVEQELTRSLQQKVQQLLNEILRLEPFDRFFPRAH